MNDRPLMLPDWSVNNRIDTLRNIASDPWVGLPFLIPGIGDTLRVHVLARILDDDALSGGFEIAGTRPATILDIALIRVIVDVTGRSPKQHSGSQRRCLTALACQPLALSPLPRPRSGARLRPRTPVMPSASSLLIEVLD
jgi:hypothetical protein